MSKRINDTKLRRQQILKSARKVFMEKGFQGATIDDIATEEGVVRGTILYHYKSKKLLMEAVLEEDSREWIPLFTSLVTKHETPVLERINRMFELCGAYAASEKAELGNTGEKTEEMRFFLDQIHLKNFYRQTENLTALLEEGAAAGEVYSDNPKIQAAATMFAVFGMMGEDISEEEMGIQLQIIKEQLLTAVAGNRENGMYQCGKE